MDQLFKKAIEGYCEFLASNSEYMQERARYIEKINKDDASAVMEFAQLRIRYRLHYLDFMEGQSEIVEFLKSTPEREHLFLEGGEHLFEYKFALNDRDELIIIRRVNQIAQGETRE